MQLSLRSVANFVGNQKGSARVKLVAALAVLLVLVSVTAYVVHAVTQATISTNKNKYALGETMYISGSGFAPSSAIGFSVETPSGAVEYPAGTTADASGSFSNAPYTPAQPAHPGRYKITATDGSSSATSASTEADAIGYNKAIYKKGAVLPNNDTLGTWTTGNAGQNFIEGDWVFYEYQVTGVTSSTPDFDIYWDDFPGTGVFIDAVNNLRACVDTHCEGVATSGNTVGMLVDGGPTPPATTAGGWI